METGIFLFTDIESSTRRWAEHPESMAGALRLHDEVLRGILAEHGGTVFKHTGDGLVARYSSAADALAAAVAGQWALAAADWGDIDRMQVRMAIHAGEAELRGGDWYGPALNRAARLMGIGHGGQILVSGAARARMIDRPPDDVVLVPLGEHRLRDLFQPEDVWQAIAPGLERDFPPLRSMNDARGNLPVQLTSFVGRARELGELCDELLSHRLTTVVGPGGMGKTRLALEAAAARGDDFPDGAWFVDLAPLPRGAAIDYATAAALEVDTRGDASPRERLISDFRGRQALIVLDNCEHVVEGAAATVGAWLVGCLGVTVLATSRVPLGVAGERVWALPPLPAREGGFDLFVDRASAARRDLRLTEAEQPAVLDLCERLDGLPLAIELAAARARAMTVGELAAHLDERFRLLRAGRPEGGRHATLSSAVAWSYELLTPDQQCLLDGLSIFAGDFDLGAAEAVCAPDEEDELDTLDRLDALVEQSLVIVDTVDGRSRYRLLETIRQYGAGRLDDPARRELGRRHAELYARRLGEPRGGPALRPADEVANLRAAVGYAVERADADLALRLVEPLWTELAMSHALAEAEEWARAALRLPGAADHPRSRWAHLLLGFATAMRSDGAAAEGHSLSAIAVTERLGLEHDARAWMHLAATRLAMLGKFSEAIDDAIRAATIAAAAGQTARRVEAWSYVAWATVLDDRDIDAQTLAEIDEAAASSSSPFTKAWVAYGHAMAASRSDPAEAGRLLGAAVVHAEHAGHEPFATLCRGIEPLFAHPDDPVAALAGLEAVLASYAVNHQSFELRLVLRDTLRAWVELERLETVAVLDGAARPGAWRPALARQAVGAARLALGDERYERHRRLGARLTDAELAAFLRDELASIPTG